MNEFLGQPFILWTGVCLAIAGIYLFVWPKLKAGLVRPPWLNFVLRWFHTLVWVLLAAACLAWDRGYPSLGGPLALAAMLCYGIFLASLVFDRRQNA